MLTMQSQRVTGTGVMNDQANNNLNILYYAFKKAVIRNRPSLFKTDFELTRQTST
jgi:hypothetical protein